MHALERPQVFPCLIFTAPWLPGEQREADSRVAKEPGMHGDGEGKAEPRDVMLLLRAILGFLGFVTRKDEKQSETEGTKQDQVPESR